MTPAARIQAAIDILDTVLAGQPAEQALTRWARGNRFAGSKDRAAIRDLVFDAMRAQRSLAVLGGARSGRGLMLGLGRRQAWDLEALFSGAKYAPAPLETEERTTPRAFASDAERLDIPDWLWPEFQAAMQDRSAAAAQALQHRAPVHLRVNARKASVPQVQDMLAADGIETRPFRNISFALEAVQGERKIRNSAAYQQGLVELQDAASQAVVLDLPLRDGMRVLDFCAGGGGKALAMAAQTDLQVTAHDISAARMGDIPARAQRAGVRIETADLAQVTAQAPFDLVLVDAPCSGSGAWRRAPQGKWDLTPDRFAEIQQLQARILQQAAALVAPQGWLIYATCSLFHAENHAQVTRFVDHDPRWRVVQETRWDVSDGTDGFFSAHLTRF